MRFFILLKLKNLVIYICIILLSTKCAQITPLTGGKTDATPPKVILCSPKNASINFNQKTIEIDFDEFITLKDLVNQFIITPQTNQFPNIQVIGKKIKIEFKEELLANTTYKLFFGNSIVDIRENNPLSNFEYIFSTGNIIDNQILKGNVINSENSKPLPNILVGLYKVDAIDSIIFKEKPIYASITNANGEFSFNYLPKADFKLIAIKDENKNLMYDGSIEQIGFKSEKISTIDTSIIQLRLFREIPTKQFLKKTITPEYGKAVLIYNMPCSKDIKINAKGLSDYAFNATMDSISLYYKNVFDTLKIVVSDQNKHNDSISILIPSENDFTKIKKNKGLKYTIKPNFSKTFPYFETLTFDLNAPFNFENINKLNLTMIEAKDSIKTKMEFEILKNEERPNSYHIKTKLKGESSYIITFNKELFKNDIGRTNDSISYLFNTTSEDDYGKLNLKLTFPKKGKYLILLLNENNEIVKKSQIELSLSSSSTNNFTFNNLLPGSYFMKVVEDANKNNQFDTGNYFKKIQPEIIYFNHSPIKILSGWEIENEWIIN